MVLRYRMHLEQRHYAPATINLRLAAVRRIAYEAADAGPGLYRHHKHLTTVQAAEEEFPTVTRPERLHTTIRRNFAADFF